MTNRNEKGNLKPARDHIPAAFKEHGDKALVDPRDISALADLRQLVKSESGRMDLREELTARVGLLVTLGFSSLFDRYGDPDLPASLRIQMWDDPVMKRLTSLTNIFDRLLKSIPSESDVPSDYDAELAHIRKVVDAEPE